jgi:CMP/dCMP kinase
MASFKAMQDGTGSIEPMVVAIDGPAGAGKSTLARRLAVELGMPYVNTGLMYRALAARALDTGTDPADEAALGRLAREMRFALGEGEPPELLIDGRPPDPSLASPEVEAIVSEVARHPEVRTALRDAQRTLGGTRSIMEGRDIGTVVLPHANVKIFLSASPDIRAGRRVRERGGGDDTARGVSRRDSLDARTNPFEPASDAVVIDTTHLDRDEVFARSLAAIRAAMAEGPAR